jgi:hypothetical protein
MTGTTLSAGSIDLPAPGDIISYGNSSITSSAFSNAGTVSVGSGTLRLIESANAAAFCGLYRLTVHNDD